ncbi:hypothetical protein, partial [Candidatus Magnetaquicoccus inordinatus]|uniref:hypothetical protein n=1 Tax=Candidatus Magnetaquicoccus inordinatus TaxID=2496818 RepID=UPI001D0E65F4
MMGAALLAEKGITKLVWSIPFQRSLCQELIVCATGRAHFCFFSNYSPPKTTAGPGRAPPWPGPGMESL